MSTAPSSTPPIRIRGARTHNLKGVDLDLPRQRLVVFTGPSGSGKSSLAFDTIAAEGQRRYLESLSSRSRHLLGPLARPDVDELTGLPPTIAIAQDHSPYGPRATVGTVTELDDHLRLLFARAGLMHCPTCARPVEKLTPAQILDRILAEPDGSRHALLAPLAAPPTTGVPKGERPLRSKETPMGPSAVSLGPAPASAVASGAASRAPPAPAAALRGPSLPFPADPSPLLAELAAQGFQRVRLDGQILDLTDLAAPSRSARKPRPVTVEAVIDRLVIRHPSPDPHHADPGAQSLRARLIDSLETALHLGRGVVILAPQPRPGHPADPADPATHDRVFSTLMRCDHCALELPELSPRLLSFSSPQGACPSCQGLGTTSATPPATPTPCSDCGGSRLSPPARSVRLANHTLPSLLSQPIAALRPLLATLPLTPAQATIARHLLAEADQRLRFLVEVGLGYLSLGRSADTLSSGEAQRIRLTSQLGSELSGLLYVLDEPSAGLHAADTAALVTALRRLVDQGNSVLCVEHDPHIIAAADLIVDLGPGAGALGGELLAVADPSSLAEPGAHPRSVTGPWLTGQARIPESSDRPPANSWIHLHDISIQNLKSVSARIPKSRLTAVTGVSGAGKTSLVMRALLPALRHHLDDLEGDAPLPPALGRVTGHEGLDKVVTIDQSPIGRSPRSNPATFTKVFDEIRQLFAATRDAKARGFGAARFSFNAKGGRCEACEGDGLVRVEMHFLPDVWVTCETCRGRRYNEPTLAVRYKGLDIAQVLELTVAEARDIFAPVTRIARVLDTLAAVGLGYLTLGQPAQTLSGGEAQRLKLASQLARPATGQTLFLLDEPSAGLHFADLERLIDVLSRLVDRGNTVVLVDHRLHLVMASNWVLELGPEGGDGGGHLLFEGPPADLARAPTPTGRALAQMLAKRP